MLLTSLHTPAPNHKYDYSLTQAFQPEGTDCIKDPVLNKLLHLIPISISCAMFTLQRDQLS